MSRFQHIARVAAIGVIAVLLALSSAAAQEADRRSAPTVWSPAVMQNPKIGLKNAEATAASRIHQQSAVAPKTLAREAHQAQRSKTDNKEHHLILQVNTNDPAAMNLALNNATNVAQYYKERGEMVKVEVVTFGPGLHMLRDDTSPVKARIEVMALSSPEVSYKACGNTKENMHKAENKDIPIIPQAEVVKSGVVRVMELQEQGWTYVKP
jgi:uncharacterized protein